MFFECGVGDQAALVVECGNSVAEFFSGFRWNCGANGRAEFLERGSRGLWDFGQVGFPPLPRLRILAFPMLFFRSPFFSLYSLFEGGG